MLNTRLDNLGKESDHFTAPENRHIPIMNRAPSEISDRAPYTEGFMTASTNLASKAFRVSGTQSELKRPRPAVGKRSSVQHQSKHYQSVEILYTIRSGYTNLRQHAKGNHH